MGWIYNGSEFIKANKSQREAYTKYQRELTIRGALAQPAALPTIAILGLTLAGVPLGIKLFKNSRRDIRGCKENCRKNIEEKVIDPAKPAAAIAADIADCVSSARFFPWGSCGCLECLKVNLPAAL